MYTGLNSEEIILSVFNLYLSVYGQIVVSNSHLFKYDAKL